MHAISVTGFDHLVLACRKARTTRAFYEGVLGFRVSGELPQWGMTELTAGNAVIVLVDVASKEGGWAVSPKGEGENMNHYCLRLKSFDEAGLRALLAKNGIAIEEEQHDDTPEGPEHAFYVRDPDGNYVELRGLMVKK